MINTNIALTVREPKALAVARLFFSFDFLSDRLAPLIA
jgi:hypothetical protein